MEKEIKKLNKEIIRLLLDQNKQIRTKGYVNSRTYNNLSKKNNLFVMYTDYKVKLVEGEIEYVKQYQEEPVVNLKYVI